MAQFEHIPMLLRLGIDVVFAFSVVALTHFTAKLLQKERLMLENSTRSMRLDNRVLHTRECSQILVVKFYMGLFYLNERRKNLF